MAKDRQGSYYATKPDLSNVGRLQVYKASEGGRGFPWCESMKACHGAPAGRWSLEPCTSGGRAIVSA